MKFKLNLYFGTFIIASFLACEKDKVDSPCPPQLEPDKWEMIEGQYKVYDSLGGFLYDMSITHIATTEFNNDSLKFENFDGEFTFTTKQTNFTNESETLISIGYHDTLLDSQSKRWKLLATNDLTYNNVLLNDTIRMNFGKTNINYYTLDLVPFYSCDCKQIAVKQN